jgi:hypothetical protein
MLQEMSLVGSRDVSYQPCAGRQIVVRAGQPGRSNGVMTRVSLLNISQGVAKIVGPVSLECSQAIELRLQVAELDMELRATANVKRTCLTKDGQWHIGCVIEPRIHEEVLSELASKGYLERRREQRVPISIEATAQWEMDTETVKVRFDNFSSSGFCFTAPKKGQVGQRVRISLEEGQEGAITARAVWHMKQDNGYLVGCELLDPDDASRLRAYVGEKGLGQIDDEKLQLDAGVEPSQTRRRTRRRLLRCALVIALIVASVQAGRTSIRMAASREPSQMSSVGTGDESTSKKSPSFCKDCPNLSSVFGSAGRYLSLPTKRGGMCAASS